MKIVQIVPLGIEKDRVVKLLEEYPPHKVYFIRNSSPAAEHKEMEKVVDKIQKEMKKLVPLAQKVYLKMNYADFKEPFIQFLEIMQKEKKAGNDVIVNISSCARIIAFAAWVSASITNCRVFYLLAKKYGLKSGFSAEGVADVIEMSQFPIVLPTDIETSVLNYLLRQNKPVTVSLRELANGVGLKNLGKINSIQSGIVKMSYCLRELERKKYVTIQNVSRKRQKLTLAESGEMMAKAMGILAR